MMLRFLPVTHDLWKLPRLTHFWINLNKYPHLSTREAKILIGRLICTSKDLKKSPWILKFCPWNVLECPWILSWQNPMNPALNNISIWQLPVNNCTIAKFDSTFGLHCQNCQRSTIGHVIENDSPEITVHVCISEALLMYGVLVAYWFGDSGTVLTLRRGHVLCLPTLISHDLLWYYTL